MAVNKVRRNGSYAPLSAHYYKDDAIDDTAGAAELLYVRGLAFCADVLSDGFISDRQLVRFVGVGMFDAIDRAMRLVEVGLWENVDGGYRVRSWLDWNRSRAEIEALLADEAARKMSPALRAQVLERDEHACRGCGATEDLQIDHVFPWSLGGRHGLDNLQVLCGPCNRRKGARVT